MGGRPVKLTPEVQDRIVRALRNGNCRSDAAIAGGINRDTLRRWMNLGAAGNKRYSGFYGEVLAAEYYAVERFVDTIRKVGTGEVLTDEIVTTNPDGTTTTHKKYAPPDWRCAGWYLERRRRRAFGRPYRPVDGPTDNAAADAYLAKVANAQDLKNRKPSGGTAGDAD